MAWFDWIVGRGWLDRWRGTEGLIGRAVMRADVRWLHRIERGYPPIPDPLPPTPPPPPPPPIARLREGEVMELTTRDLGVKTEQITYQREYRMHVVDGLPDGAKAMIAEEHGVFRVYILDVHYPASDTARPHDSLESALDELRRKVES